MKIRNIILLLLLSTFQTGAQTFYSPCKDPLKIENIYYNCADDYFPVCACDGNTYRSICAAENKYAINTNNWIAGPCTGFDFDISPNAVDQFLLFKLYRKKSGYFTITIFDVYGHIFFSQAFLVSDPAIRFDKDIPLFNFDHGLYIIEVVSDGEQQVKKFYKLKTD